MFENDSIDEKQHRCTVNNVYFLNYFSYWTNLRHHCHVKDEFANTLKDIEKNCEVNIDKIHDDKECRDWKYTREDKHNVRKKLLMDKLEEAKRLKINIDPFKILCRTNSEHFVTQNAQLFGTFENQFR